MVSSTELENAIRSKVQNVTALVVSDVSGGCGQAYDVIIVSEAFEGLPTLKRHRMVNELLKDQIAELHAFSQKTYTPKQYETMASKDSTTSTASSTTPNPPTTSTSTTTSSSEPPRFLSTLDTTSPVPSKNSNRSHHRTRSSNVSVPELTLTTDVDDEPNQTSNTPSHGRKPSGGSSAGSPSPRSVAQSLDYDAFGDGGMLPQSPSLPNISRLLHGKVTDPEFWQELHTFLTSQTSLPNGAASPTLASGSASPAPSSPSLNRRPVGASEAEKLWEDFFQSQKQYLTASEAAKIRDVTGLFGLGGQ